MTITALNERRSFLAAWSGSSVVPGKGAGLSRLVPPAIDMAPTSGPKSENQVRRDSFAGAAPWWHLAPAGSACRRSTLSASSSCRVRLPAQHPGGIKPRQGPLVGAARWSHPAPAGSACRRGTVVASNPGRIRLSARQSYCIEVPARAGYGGHL